MTSLKNSLVLSLAQLFNNQPQGRLEF